MSYSILDKDTGNYLATGRNSAIALYGYLDGSDSFSGEDYTDKEKWRLEAERDPYEFANSFNFEICLNK